MTAGLLYFTGNALDWAGLLLCASAGFVFCSHAGLFNIGIEGQIYTGGFCASFVMLAVYPSFSRFPALVTVCGIFAAIISGGFLGLFCGLLKRFFRANEMITSFLLSAFLIPLLDYLTGGPLRGTDGNLLAMQRLPENLVYRRLLPPSNLNISFGEAFLVVFAAYAILYRTPLGYRLRLAGFAPAFARYAGIRPERFWGGSLAVSGACAGLAGFMMVAGTNGICHQSFPAGLGWAAIAVGLIARNKPLLLFPAALFYTALKFITGAGFLGSGFSSSVFTLLTGLVLLFATAKSGKTPA